MWFEYILRLCLFLHTASNFQWIFLFTTFPPPAFSPHIPPSSLRPQIETHVDGQRVRYFQDDDNMGLKEMVRREKMSSAQDQNALYSSMAAKVRTPHCNLATAGQCWTQLGNKERLRRNLIIITRMNSERIDSWPYRNNNLASWSVIPQSGNTRARIFTIWQPKSWCYHKIAALNCNYGVKDSVLITL